MVKMWKNRDGLLSPATDLELFKLNFSTCSLSGIDLGQWRRSKKRAEECPARLWSRSSPIPLVADPVHHLPAFFDCSHWRRVWSRLLGSLIWLCSLWTQTFCICSISVMYINSNSIVFSFFCLVKSLTNVVLIVELRLVVFSLASIYLRPHVWIHCFKLCCIFF